jgi:hypothetical protein
MIIHHSSDNCCHPMDLVRLATVVMMMTTSAAADWVSIFLSHTLFRFAMLCVCVACFYGPPCSFLGGRKKRKKQTKDDHDDDDETMVDDCDRRCSSGPWLDQPIPRHDDAFRCRTRSSTFLLRRRGRTMGQYDAAP